MLQQFLYPAGMVVLLPLFLPPRLDDIPVRPEPLWLPKNEYGVEPMLELQPVRDFPYVAMVCISKRYYLYRRYHDVPLHRYVSRAP